MSDAVRIVQLSDTHFLSPGESAEGGGAYDTSEAFDAVFEHVGDTFDPHLVVVTGDVADHGRIDQYRVAAQSFGRFDVPVNVCPGNHDQDLALTTGVGSPTVGTSRVIESGGWCFVFADSNAGVMHTDDVGRRVDPPDYGDRLHRNGALGDHEAAWIRDVCSATTADHVFVWIHHPPSAPVPMVDDPPYAAEWDQLLSDLPMIKGIGAGHTHIPDVYELAGREVFVAPSLKNNFDFRNRTWLPPGYRTFEFSPSGDISSDCHLVDDERWPRRTFGRALYSLFNGEISHAQLQEIAERRAREGR